MGAPARSPTPPDKSVPRGGVTIPEGPSAGVLGAFGLAGAAQPLTGGMEPAFLIDGVVLKRADGAEELAWKAPFLAGLVEDGFRVARPLAARDGAWSVDGWMASHYVTGTNRPTPWEQMLSSSRAFHRALAREGRPGFLDTLTHRWARAHRVAWGELDVELHSEVATRLSELWALTEDPADPAQLIHGDLAGNVLFAPGLAPAVIDFSPWWAPVSYAEGILVADGILWFGGGPSLLALAGEPERIVPAVARGAIFRLVALNEGLDEGHPEYLADAARFDSLIDLLKA